MRLPVARSSIGAAGPSSAGAGSPDDEASPVQKCRNIPCSFSLHDLAEVVQALPLPDPPQIGSARLCWSAANGGPKRGRCCDGTSCRSGRRLRCVDWSVERHGTGYLVQMAPRLSESDCTVVRCPPPAQLCMRPLLHFSPTAAATLCHPTQWSLSVSEQVAEAHVFGQFQQGHHVLRVGANPAFSPTP